MVSLDRSPDVLEWSSEEITIPYYDPTTGRVRRYFPDFWVRKKDGTFLFEVKPAKETQPPSIKSGKRPSPRLIREVMTYGVNQAKWEAAKSFCEDRGWTFHVLTEKDLGLLT